MVEVIIGDRLKVVGKPKNILRKIPKSSDPQEEFLRRRVRAALKGKSSDPKARVRISVDDPVEPAVETPSKEISQAPTSFARQPSVIQSFISEPVIPVGITTSQAIGESLGIAGRKFRSKFITREEFPEEAILSPFGRVERARLGRLTPRQVKLLQEEGIGTPFVSKDLVEVFEPNISKTELERRFREQQVQRGFAPPEILIPKGFREQEFIRQEKKGVLKDLQKTLDIETARVQGLIDDRAITLEEGRGLLESKKTGLVELGQTQLEERVKARKQKDIGIEKRLEKTLGSIDEPSKTFAKRAPLVFELTAVPLLPSGAVNVLGATRIISGAQKQDVAEVLGGATLVGLGTAGQVSKVRRIFLEEESLKGIKAAKKLPFEIAELRFQGGEGRVTGVVARGVRKAKGIEEQLDISGKLIREGGKSKFVFDDGLATFKRTQKLEGLGRIETFRQKPASIKGLLSPQPFKFEKPVQVGTLEKIRVSQKGFTIDLSPKASVAIAETRTQPILRTGFAFKGDTLKGQEKAIGKQFTRNFRVFKGKIDSELVGGLNIRLNKNTTFFRAGRIKDLGINQTEGGRLSGIAVNIDDSAKGIARTFRNFPIDDVPKGKKIIDIVPPKGGLKANLPKAPKLSQLDRSFGKTNTLTTEFADTRQTLGTTFAGTQRAISKEATRFSPSLRETSLPAGAFGSVLGTGLRLQDRQSGVVSVLEGVAISPREIGRSALSPAQPSGLKPREKLALRPALKLDFKISEPVTPIPTSQVTPRLGGEGFRFPSFFLLPPFPSFGIIETPRKSVRISRGFKRAPSFAAVQLGFEAAAPSPLEFTGLVERPIIRKKRKKRKK